MLAPDPDPKKLKVKTGKMFTFLHTKSHIRNLYKIYFRSINGKFTLFQGLFEVFLLFGGV